MRVTSEKETVSLRDERHMVETTGCGWRQVAEGSRTEKLYVACGCILVTAGASHRKLERS